MTGGFGNVTMDDDGEQGWAKDGVATTDGKLILNMGAS